MKIASAMDAQAMAAKRLERVDQMDPDTRALVHEFGYTMVREIIQAGVVKPSVIRHIILAVMAGQDETRRLWRGTAATSHAGERMDEALHQLCVVGVTGQAVVEAHRRAGGICLSRQPTHGMVAASMSALHNRGLGHAFKRPIGEVEKHQLRLLDALREAERLQMTPIRDLPEHEQALEPPQ